MTGVQLAYALLVGALLAGTARCLSAAFRLAGRPTRWVWMGALGLTAVLVGLAPYRVAPPAPAPVTTPAMTAGAPLPQTVWIAPAPAAPDWLDRLHRVGPAMAAPMQAAIAAVGARVPAALVRHFPVLWLSLSTVLLLLCAATYVRFYRLRRSWPLTDLDGVRVRVAPDGGPAVVGWSRPEIIIPQWLLRHSREERRLVLAHEREHVNARDPLLIAVGCAAAVLLPWHPAVWWMFARLRLAVELDCDGRVLRQGITPRKYGALLIDLAGRCPGLPVGAPALADKSSHLKQRLLAMRAPRLSFARTRGAALGGLALLVLIAACVVQVPRVVAQDDGQAGEPLPIARVNTAPAAPVQTISLLESTTPAAPATSPDRNRATPEPKPAPRHKRPTPATSPDRAPRDSTPTLEAQSLGINGMRAFVALPGGRTIWRMRQQPMPLEISMPDSVVVISGVAANVVPGKVHIEDMAIGTSGHMTAHGNFQVRFEASTPVTAADSSDQQASNQIELPMLQDALQPLSIGLISKLTMLKAAPVIGTITVDPKDSSSSIGKGIFLLAPSHGQAH